jgi:hypothetical protein
MFRADSQSYSTSKRALQQEGIADAPTEQEVAAYLAELAAAAGMRVEDLQFDSSLDEKVRLHATCGCCCCWP